MVPVSVNVRTPEAERDRTNLPWVRNIPGVRVTGFPPVKVQSPVPTRVKLPSAPNVSSPGPVLLTMMVFPVTRLVIVCVN